MAGTTEGQLALIDMGYESDPPDEATLARVRATIAATRNLLPPRSAKEE